MHSQTRTELAPAPSSIGQVGRTAQRFWRGALGARVLPVASHTNPFCYAWFVVLLLYLSAVFTRDRSLVHRGFTFFLLKGLSS